MRLIATYEQQQGSEKLTSIKKMPFLVRSEGKPINHTLDFGCVTNQGRK